MKTFIVVQDGDDGADIVGAFFDEKKAIQGIKDYINDRFGFEGKITLKGYTKDGEKIISIYEDDIEYDCHFFILKEVELK